jgi:F-type H+-transporting ATPase subunit delta
MRETTIARNYAEAYLELARRAGDLEGWRTALDGLAGAISADSRLCNFLAAPQISAADKSAVMERALGGRLPRTMLRFLQKVIANRRQLLIPAIAVEFGNLVDEVEGRLHARVTVALEADDEIRHVLVRELSRVFGRVVVPHIEVNHSLLGGLIVRVGDRVIDGSVRRRLRALRAQLLAGRIALAAGAGR